MIYLDHAASSWPKPTGVVEAMAAAVTEYGANPGRGAHQLSMRASRTVFQARVALAKLFGVKDPNRFIFTKNTTEAINCGLFGFLKSGDHVVCTSIEHNSVRRPLEYLKKNRAISVSYLKHEETGLLDLNTLKSCITAETKLIVVTHASNLLGAIIDLAGIKEIAKQYHIPVFVDAAQTAGVHPLDIGMLELDFVAFPGHKGLLGPQGTGALYVAPQHDLDPFVYGGTGSKSEEIEQPKLWPEGFEAGTLNTPGIAGLHKGIEYVLANQNQMQHEREWELTQEMMQGLLGIEGIRILGPALGEKRCGLVSFVHERVDAAEFAYIMDQHYQICIRSGYHCAPLAHQLAGTMETGAIRASVGWTTTLEDVQTFITASKEIIKSIS